MRKGLTISCSVFLPTMLCYTYTLSPVWWTAELSHAFRLSRNRLEVRIEADVRAPARLSAPADYHLKTAHL
jgi:hypothetical protein